MSPQAALLEDSPELFQRHRGAPQLSPIACAGLHELYLKGCAHTHTHTHTETTLQGCIQKY